METEKKRSIFVRPLPQLESVQIGVRMASGECLRIAVTEKEAREILNSLNRLLRNKELIHDEDKS